MDTRIVFLIMTAIFVFIPFFKAKRRKNPVSLFSGIRENTMAMFLPPLLWLMTASIVLTPFLTAVSLDLELQKIFQSWIPHRDPLMWQIFIIGNYWHIVPSLVLYAAGLAAGKVRILAAGAAGLQSLFLCGWIVLGLKLLTGRRGPARFAAAAAGAGDEAGIPFIRSIDPWDYQFDFWNRVFSDGRFFWPSGHTATIFAFVSSLAALYPEKRLIALIGYLLAFGMGAVMTVGNFHWISDVIAGALIGHAAGWAVGKGMRKRLDQCLIKEQKDNGKIA